jgi:hypothetical protein
MRPSAVFDHAARTGRKLPVLALALLLAPLAGAGESSGPGRVFEREAAPVQGIREAPRAAAEKSTDRIVRDVEKKHKAKVIKDPEVRQIDGRRVLVLRLYDEKKGRVWEVRVDAETGKEL